MTTLLDDRRSAATEPVPPKRVTPVKWWASGGIVILSLMAFSYGRWLLGGHAHSVSSGSAVNPSWMVFAVRVHEIGFSIWAMICIYLYIIKPWRAQRRLTANGILLISLGTIWMFADPLTGYFRVAYLYNSAAVNLGCPQCYLPGWQSRIESFSEPILFGGMWYISMWVTVTVVGCRILGWYRRRWPDHGRIAAVMFVLGVMTIFDLFCEIYWIRLGLYVYPNMPFALWDNHYYRVPLMEIVFTGLWYTAVVCCRYFTNDKGETWAERGLNEMRVSTKKRTGLRILASIAMYNAAIFLVYWIPMGFQSAINKDAWPEDIYNRPYLVHEMCGPGTEYACLDKRVPIPPAPSSAHISPEGKLIAPNGLPIQKGK